MWLAGFEVADAIALLRLDDLFVECFEVKDVKVRLGYYLGFIIQMSKEDLATIIYLC